MAGQMARMRHGEEVCISYLPLSHVAAQMLDIYMPLIYGGTCYFAQPDALKVRHSPPGPLSSTLCVLWGLKFVDITFGMFLCYSCM